MTIEIDAFEITAAIALRIMRSYPQFPRDNVYVHLNLLQVISPRNPKNMWYHGEQLSVTKPELVKKAASAVWTRARDISLRKEVPKDVVDTHSSPKSILDLCRRALLLERDVKLEISMKSLQGLQYKIVIAGHLTTSGRNDSDYPRLVLFLDQIVDRDELEKTKEEILGDIEKARAFHQGSHQLKVDVQLSGF